MDVKSDGFKDPRLSDPDLSLHLEGASSYSSATLVRGSEDTYTGCFSSFDDDLSLAIWLREAGPNTAPATDCAQRKTVLRRPANQLVYQTSLSLPTTAPRERPTCKPSELTRPLAGAWQLSGPHGASFSPFACSLPWRYDPGNTAAVRRAVGHGADLYFIGDSHARDLFYEAYRMLTGTPYVAINETFGRKEKHSNLFSRTRDFSLFFVWDPLLSSPETVTILRAMSANSFALLSCGVHPAVNGWSAAQYQEVLQRVSSQAGLKKRGNVLWVTQPASGAKGAPKPCGLDDLHVIEYNQARDAVAVTPVPIGRLLAAPALPRFGTGGSLLVAAAGVQGASPEAHLCLPFKIKNGRCS